MRFLIQTLSLLLLLSCVNQLPEQPGVNDPRNFIVDGFLSDEPGPYTVRTFSTRGVYSNLDAIIPVSVKSMAIIVDESRWEPLTLVEPGVYSTEDNGFRGEQGHSYVLHFEDFQGRIFESSPQEIFHAGAIDSIYYRFDWFVDSDNKSVEGFRIFFDAQAIESENKFYRWRYQGTYRIMTHPERRTRPGAGANSSVQIPDPPGCASVRQPDGSTQCECCVCWITDAEDYPRVTNLGFVAGGKTREVEVDFVPITGWTFFDKYRIEVKQMSLNPDAYEFWNIVGTQRSRNDDLFQPPGGSPAGNIFQVNGDAKAQGLFYAAGVTVKSIYISRDDARKFTIVPIEQADDDCRLFGKLVVTEKPAFWQD